MRLKLTDAVVKAMELNDRAQLFLRLAEYSAYNDCHLLEVIYSITAAKSSAAACELAAKALEENDE